MTLAEIGDLLKLHGATVEHLQKQLRVLFPEPWPEDSHRYINNTLLRLQDLADSSTRALGAIVQLQRAAPLAAPPPPVPPAPAKPKKVKK